MKVFLIAGEPSGDALGAALIAGLRQLSDISVFGIGGPKMEAEGVRSLFPMSDLSVMGVTEVLPRLPHLLRRRDEAVGAILDGRPDVLITIDSPDFCLRVAARVRAARRNQKVIHYVAPSVWAWRKGRAARMARNVDHVLALLPFEPPLMRAAGMGCDFVGHPVVAEPLASPEDIAAFRAEMGEQIVLVLPGSRQGEIARLAPVFGEVLERLPFEAQAVIPTLPHLEGTVRDAVAHWPRTPRIVTDDGPRRAAFGAATAALAASGSVSLQLAANRVPMVIAYDMSWLSWQILSRMVQVDTVTLVNLVAGRKAVPEFLGPDCKSDRIARALSALMLVPSEREKQREALDIAMDRLGRGAEAPGLRAARSVLAQL